MYILGCREMCIHMWVATFIKIMNIKKIGLEFNTFVKIEIKQTKSVDDDEAKTYLVVGELFNIH